MPLEKQSLNNFLPDGFETLNQEGYKTNFSEDKIKTGYEKDIKDRVSGPNLNNFIDVVGKNTNILSKFLDFIKNMPVNSVLKINSNNQIDYQDIGDIDNKVSKSGDTMTGVLNIEHNTWGSLILKNSNIDINTPPSTKQYMGMDFRDNAGNRLGFFGIQQDTTGETFITFQAQKSKGVIAPTPPVDDNSTKIATTAFVETKLPASRFDGQWVRKSQRIADTVSLAVTNGDTTIEYDLSSYLPNDNYKYEVLVSMDVATGAKGGAYINGSLYGTGTASNANLYARMINVAAASAFTFFDSNNAIIPIGTNRKLGFLYQVGSVNATLNSIHLEGYRRIGTNA